MSRTVFHRYGLGRKLAVDPNDGRFLASVPPDLPTRTTRWRRGPTLNQYETPKCVEFAAKATIMAQPFMHSVDVVLRLLDRLYEQAQDLDEWEGHDYEGTSTRGAMKALQQRGLITNYYWIKTEATLRKYVTSISPVMCGFSWLTSMFEPDSDGFVHCVGGEEGGHEICCLWYDPTPGYYVFQNSWGEEWGRRGLFFMYPEDVKLQLESLGGEACVAPEVKLVQTVG